MVSPQGMANAPMVNFNNILNVKDSRWLQSEVCREFQRNKCSRADTECKFAHPPANVEVQNGKVTACYDSIKGRCNREKPPCKYFHPPNHLKEQLLINGRNTLALKNAAFMMQGLTPGTQLVHQSLPLTPSWRPSSDGNFASTPYMTNMPTMANFNPYIAASSPMMTVGVSESQMTAPMVLPQQVISTQKVPRTDRLEAYTGMGIPYKRPISDKTGGLQVYQPTSNAAYHQALMQQLGAQSYVPVSCEYPAGGSTNTPTNLLALPPPPTTVATDIAAAACHSSSTQSLPTLNNHLISTSVASSSNSQEHSAATAITLNSQPSSSSVVSSYNSHPSQTSTASTASSATWKDACRTGVSPTLAASAVAAATGPLGLPTVPPPPLPTTVPAAQQAQAAAAAAQSASFLSYQAYAAAYNKSVMAAAAARQQLKATGYPSALGHLPPTAVAPAANAAAVSQVPQIYQMGAMQMPMFSPASAAATMPSYIPSQGGFQMATANIGGAMTHVLPSGGAPQYVYPGAASAMVMPHMQTVPAGAAVQQVVEQPYKKLKTS